MTKSTEHRMTWNQTLQRRFCSTGHFRLLNQVRSELRNSPIERDERTRELLLQSKVTKHSLTRNNKRINTMQVQEQISNEMDSESISQTSFRERLDAIQMR